MSKEETISRLNAEGNDVLPDQSWTIRTFRPEDGHGIVRTVFLVYGDKYPVEDFYSPERLSDLNERGDMITIVAITERGDVVGHASLWRTSAPNPHLFEFGQMIVLPAYRKRTMAMRLTEKVRQCMKETEAVHAVFAECVTNHVTTQKLATMLGVRPCALELGLMPDGQFAGEGAGVERVSCLVVAVVLRDERRLLHLPEDDRALLTHIVSGLGIERDVSFSLGEEPEADHCGMRIQDFGSASVARCHLATVGADLVTRIEDVVRSGFTLVEVFINASTSAAPWAVEQLRNSGFFLAGVVPQWFGADAILMLRLQAAIDTGAIQVWSADSKKLADAVIASYHESVRQSVV